MKKYLTTILFIVLLILIAGCGTQGQDVIKVGVISIMSGDFAVVGEQVQRSVELTLQDLDNPHNVQFIFEDGQCDKKLSTTAARKLIDVDKVHMILAAGCSDTTIAIAPIANEEHIVILMPSTGGENIDTAGEYVFRNGNSDILSAVQPAHDFIDIFNFNTIALISDETEAMADIRKHFVATFEQLNGNLVLDETVDPQETDFRTIITKIQSEDPDAIFINSQTGITGAQFIKQMKELDSDIPIVTNFNTATNTQAYDIAGDAMHGIYFYDPDYNQEDARVQAFLEEYITTYGSSPPLLFHSIATRDAVVMTLEAIDNVGNDGELIHDWLLANIQDWEGYMGSISFDEAGNSQSGYTLKKVVSQGNFETVSGV